MVKGVCFGEILWDNLPTGRQLGGAPLNVAYHLNKLGIATVMLTRIGNDQDGRDLLELCDALSVPTDLFQIDLTFPTSTVEVMLDLDKNVSYDIRFPVAWDYLNFGPKELQTIKEADFFVFGSLCTRNRVSFSTLKSLVQVAKFVVLDVNLRAPFYSKQQIFELMSFAHLVKMNEDELAKIAHWLLIPIEATDREKVIHIMKYFKVQEVIVTYGASGSSYHSLTQNCSYYFPALQVNVMDTIGSGDSFLAAFLYQKFRRDRHSEVEEMLSFATTLSAFVTQSSGACPPYDIHTIRRFEWMNVTI